MQTNIEAGSPYASAGADESARGYLRRAEAACAQGNLSLGTHLYLVAAERAAADATMTDEDVASGLKHAWTLAVEARERALAEYIFDKLEPFLTSDEVSACANQLQELALMKLEEFGISRQALESMGQLQEGQTLGPDGPRLMHVEHINLPLPSALPIQEERFSQPLGQDLSQPLASDQGEDSDPLLQAVQEPASAAESGAEDASPVPQPDPASDAACDEGERENSDEVLDPQM